MYLRTLKEALGDDIITSDEAQILKVLAEALGVRPSDTAECLSVARGETTDPFDELEEDYAGHRMGDAATYQIAP